MTYDEKQEFFKSWHRWFAWYPVLAKTKNQTRRVWMKFIFRRGQLHYDAFSHSYEYWTWEYAVTVFDVIRWT